MFILRRVFHPVENSHQKEASPKNLHFINLLFFLLCYYIFYRQVTSWLLVFASSFQHFNPNLFKGRCFILKQRNAECSRSKILDVAEVEFANSGLFGASVNIIAEKAELNKRMIYHYFDSKEGLYQEVLKVNFNKIFELEKNAFSLDIHDQQENFSQKIIQAIRQGISDYYNFLKQNPNYVKLITREELAGGPYIHKLIPDTFLLGFEKLLQIYELGVKSGILKKGLDIMQIIISINAMCFIPFTRQEMLKEIWGADYDQKLEERLEHITNMILKEITENAHITEGDAK